MLLPSMYALEPTSALIMLAGIYYGAQYGGSTTAILINVPGEASSVVTALDGHQMARNGRAGTALATAALGSFFAGTVGTLVVAAFAPPLTKLAFQFGAPEYCSLMFLGLVGAVVLASGSLVKALAMVVLGLLLGQINTDVITAQPRYSFGITELMDGLNFVAIAMGVFSFGEIIANLGKPAEHREVVAQEGDRAVAVEEGLPRRVSGGRARHGSRLRARNTAGCRADAGVVHVVRGREEALQASRGIRQGRDPGRRRARGREQRRRADLVHPDADAGHPDQRGDGVDGGRDGDHGHPARAAGDDQQSRRCSGA